MLSPRPTLSKAHYGSMKTAATTVQTTKSARRRLPNSRIPFNPDKLTLVVGYESAYQAPDVRRVRADFTYNGIPYNFVVTDDIVQEAYFAKGDGSYRIEKARLCVSLAEILNGSVTKLAAAVIMPDSV
jgi:hypothetical protein